MTAQELGAGGIMAAPGLLGLSIIRELSSAPDFHLPIFLHPCFSGPLVLSADSGISPFCCYGQFSRLAGADAAIFTSFGGRFPFTEEVCRKICDGTETEMGGLRSIFPVPSGGMKWQLLKNGTSLRSGCHLPRRRRPSHRKRRPHSQYALLLRKAERSGE